MQETGAMKLKVEAEQAAAVEKRSMVEMEAQAVLRQKACFCPGLPKNLCSPPHHVLGVLQQRVLESTYNRRRTKVQQLTCKMVWSFSFYSLLVSFRLFELKNSSKTPQF